MDPGISILHQFPAYIGKSLEGVFNPTDSNKNRLEIIPCVLEGPCGNRMVSIVVDHTSSTLEFFSPLGKTINDMADAPIVGNLGINNDSEILVANYLIRKSDGSSFETVMEEIRKEISLYKGDYFKFIRTQRERICLEILEMKVEDSPSKGIEDPQTNFYVTGCIPPLPELLKCGAESKLFRSKGGAQFFPIACICKILIIKG